MVNFNPTCVLTISYACKFNILTSMEWILGFIVGGIAIKSSREVLNVMNIHILVYFDWKKFFG